MNGRLAGYPFVQARASNYAPGRQGYRPLWFIIHCTDTDYQDNYPANLGRYWSTTDTQVSVHFAASDTMVYQYVDCNDTAYQCRNPGNLRGIGVEMVGKSSWGRNEWLAHKRMFRNVATLCAAVSARYGLKCVPDLLTGAQLRTRNSGLSCHKDMSLTFQGTHTDPGPNFPWDFLFSELRIALTPVEQDRAATNATLAVDAATRLQGGEMSDADIAQIKAALARLTMQMDRTDDTINGQGVHYTGTNLAKQLGYLARQIGEIKQLITARNAAAAWPSPPVPPSGAAPAQPQ